MADPNEEWRAHLAALKEAIGTVQGQSAEITSDMASIDSKMSDISISWNSPSYGTFDDIKSWFQTCQRDLEALLEDILVRMNSTYSNYYEAEYTNYGNVSDGQSDA
ncbi:hypothetical protein [Streptomyces niveus]|uniref:WXG100 family type VII secretion target n=1 Tax=Streptomyces niveus TaxID=193462 RepID=A0ABZ1ZWV9_STRNV|nr:hypothetical protein [Streptomyces niveus]WTA63053.1 hypothetical protein OG211_33495 [Streptomyces niveus]